MCRRVTVILALLSAAAAAQAGKVRVWHHSEAAHFEKARFQGTVVTSEGALRLARELRPLADIDAGHAWDVVEDAHGILFVAAGEAGLCRLAPGGQKVCVSEHADAEVLCLVLGADGAVYAGTGPHGRILRVAGDGKATLFSQTPEAYVWSLTPGWDGALYAGTGPRGRIYRIDSAGHASSYYATHQNHVLSLAFDRRGILYGGTDKGGLVYRFDAAGKGFVVFAAPQSEIRCLLPAADGVYAGTSAPRRRGVSATLASRERSSDSELPSPTTSPIRSSSGSAVAASDASPPPAASTAERTPAAASAPPPPASGENSVYHVRADGSARELFRERELVLAIARAGTRLLIGTGTDGQLFEVDETSRERTQLARLDHGEIHALCRRRDGSVVVAAGDPARLYTLEDRHVASGTVTSDALDARLTSRWGALRWKAELPAGTRATLAVRSGNLAEPDETWSDWSAEQTDPERALAAAPPARFLQYRVTLATTDLSVSPSLGGLTLRYATANQAPEVTSIDVPDLDAANVETAKKLRLKWTARDANEDELTYDLYARKDAWPDWVLLERDIEKREYEWDTTTAPSGVYRVKVVASDRRDNASEEALTGERVSTPFPVAHEPPTVSVRVTGAASGRAEAQGGATDPLVRLAAAAYSVDGKPWVNVFPADGLLDRKSAVFRFSAEVSKVGTHVLVLRVRDAAGNVGSADAVFTTPAR